MIAAMITLLLALPLLLGQLIPQAPKDKIPMRIRQPHWDQVTAAWGSHRYDRNPRRFSEID